MNSAFSSQLLVRLDNSGDSTLHFLIIAITVPRRKLSPLCFFLTNVLCASTVPLRVCWGMQRGLRHRGSFELHAPDAKDKVQNAGNNW